jgi:dUTP pyrophosphatase
MTLRLVAVMTSPGQLALANDERILPEWQELDFGEDGYAELVPGPYRIVYNEIVHLPKDVVAFGYPRSSLLRFVADVRTAVWDAGYSGRSESLLIVNNPHGLRLKRDARVMQLVFFTLDGQTEGYRGRYQGENT